MLLQDIVHKMRELVILHQRLLDVSQRKTPMLVEGDITSLSTLLKEEAKLLKEIGVVEEERYNLTCQYAQTLRLSDKNVTLKELITVVTEQSEKQALEVLLVQLQSVLKKLKDNNDLNVNLTKDSLKYINNSMNLITSSVEVSNGAYSKPNFSQGGYNQNAGKSFFDSKI